MDITQIAQLIGSLGFPIVACCYMAWSNEKESLRHAEESAKMVEAINNNTQVLNLLSERMAHND